MDIVWAIVILPAAVYGIVCRADYIVLDGRHIISKIRGERLLFAETLEKYKAGCLLIAFRVLAEPGIVIFALIGSVGDQRFALTALGLVLAYLVYALSLGRILMHILGDDPDEELEMPLKFLVLTSIPRLVFMSPAIYVWYLFLLLLDIV